MEETINTELQLIFKVKKHQVEMIHDRGYIVPSPEDRFLNPNYTYLDFFQENQQYQPNDVQLFESLTFVYSFPSQEKIKVYFITERVGKYIEKKSIQNIMMDFQKERVNNIIRIIIISRYLINNAGLKEIDLMKSRKNWIEILYFNQLSYNITQHVYYNPHTLVDEEEGKEILERIGGKSKCPQLYSDDPVVRWFGWKPGSLIKILRMEPIENVAVNENYYYRIITNRKKGKEFTQQKMYTQM